MPQACAAEQDDDVKQQKALKAMVGFANSYCKNTKTTYCSDPTIAAVHASAKLKGKGVGGEGGGGTDPGHVHAVIQLCGLKTTCRCVAVCPQRPSRAQGVIGRPVVPLPPLRGQAG